MKYSPPLKSWNQIAFNLAIETIGLSATNKILHPRRYMTPAGRMMAFLGVNAAASTVFLGAAVVAARTNGSPIISFTNAAVAEAIICLATVVRIRPERALRRHLSQKYESQGMAQSEQQETFGAVLPRSKKIFSGESNHP